MYPTKQQDKDLDLDDDYAAEERDQYLTFNLGGELFAISILSIREIIEYTQLTLVPMMPSYIRGVINLRGSVVPVVDLLARFGQGGTDLKRRTCVVIVEVPGEQGVQELGVLVDGVNEVLEIPATDVEPPPSFGVRIRNEFISGMGKVGERFVILLDVAHALAVADLAGLQELDAAEPA